MALNLRDFLTALGKDLIRIDDEVDPITQAGALCSAAPRPILLERLRGFPGWKLCDILVKDRARQALALGTSPKSVVRELSDRMFTRVPGQSKVVPDGPCKEVKLLGNDADITKLPIPIHSEGDAGRYLGSGITITRDPDTGIRNEAIIRAMVKRSEEHTSELQSRLHLVCRLLLEKKNYRRTVIQPWNNSPSACRHRSGSRQFYRKFRGPRTPVAHRPPIDRAKRNECVDYTAQLRC